MPLYDYDCEECGAFERLGGFDEVLKPCPTCGGMAKRRCVYAPNFSMGPAMPPASETGEVYHQLGKELAKRNYPSDRVYDDLRAARTTDKEGNVGVDMSKMPQEL